MYRIICVILLGFLSFQVSAQDVAANSSTPTPTTPTVSYDHELIKNKWWNPDPAKANRNMAKQHFGERSKFRTIGSMTGFWKWKDKAQGILYVKYAGSYWEQKIIKLTSTEMIFEREGKTYYYIAPTK